GRVPCPRGGGGRRGAADPLRRARARRRRGRRSGHPVPAGRSHGRPPGRRPGPGRCARRDELRSTSAARQRPWPAQAAHGPAPPPVRGGRHRHDRHQRPDARAGRRSHPGGAGAMTRRVEVRTERPYQVVVGHALGRELTALVPDDVLRVAIIHAGPVADFARSLAARLVERQVLLIAAPDGEQAKTVAYLAHCWDELGAHGFTRSDLIIGGGGAATTDLAGFVAASWLRGVRFVTVPTTVLGMVDAAVGGKTGINVAAGKNLVGAFHEPIGVLCDLSTLADLPIRELRGGLAEVIKCGFIADPTILTDVEATPERALDPADDLLADLVTRGIAVK